MNTTTGRFHIAVKLKEFRGHIGVWLSLFHLDELPEEAYLAMIPDASLRKDADARLAADTSFDAEETAALRTWFASCPGAEFSSEAAGPVGANETGIRCYGSTSGCLDLHDFAGWPLPCRVGGYYELQAAEAGPYNPDQAQTRVRFDENA
jgi:hypothetical protein